MIYILMCGGGTEYREETPKHLQSVKGEIIVERTIRLLKENGVENSSIYISSADKRFDNFGVKRLLDTKNKFNYDNDHNDYWVSAFPKVYTEATYIFGDVYFSEDCIKKIVNTKTDDILFFSTSKPFSKDYIKDHVEPLAFKVINYNRFYKAILIAKAIQDSGNCWRIPLIAYELHCILNGFTLEYDYLKPQNDSIFGKNFVGIHDYSCDIDDQDTVNAIEKVLK